MTTKNKEAESDGIKIRFTPDAWAKMWAYTFSVTDEISGYGKVSVQDGVFTVSDVAIFEQKVSGADTEIDAASVAKFMHELHKRGEDASQWRLWWHSHNRMPVFWSGTDEHAMSPENNIGRDWLLSTVVNFKREILGRLDIYTPTHCTIDEIPVESDESINIPEAIREEVAAKVRRRVIEVPHAGFYSEGRWWEERGLTPVDVPPRYSYDDTPRVPQLPFSSKWEDDEDAPRAGYLLQDVHSGESTDDFDSIGLDDVMDEKDYTLCRRYWQGDGKLSKAQRNRAKALLEMWGVTIKEINK